MTSGPTTFGDSALRLWGQAGVALGWSADQFWAATPAELGAVADALTGREGGAEPPDITLIARMREAFPDG